MLLPFLFVFLLACIIAVIFSLNALINTLRFGLPFVSTPDWAIDWLTDNLQLTSNDTVYELGCGDARVVAVLARQHPTAQFIGLEIQWWPLLLAWWRTRNQKNIHLIHGDIFRCDLSPATVIYGFFMTGFMPKLASKLKDNLRPGTKVISYGFSFPGWSADQEIINPKKPTGSRVLVYRR